MCGVETLCTPLDVYGWAVHVAVMISLKFSLNAINRKKHQTVTISMATVYFVLDLLSQLGCCFEALQYRAEEFFMLLRNYMVYMNSGKHVAKAASLRMIGTASVRKLATSASPTVAGSSIV